MKSKAFNIFLHISFEEAKYWKTANKLAFSNNVLRQIKIVLQAIKTYSNISLTDCSSKKWQKVNGLAFGSLQLQTNFIISLYSSVADSFQLILLGLVGRISAAYAG